MEKLKKECCDVEIVLTLKTLRKNDMLDLVRKGLDYVGLRVNIIDVSFGDSYVAESLIPPWIEKNEKNLHVYCDGVNSNIGIG